MSVSTTEIQPQPGQENEGIQLLVFTLAGCECGVEIRQVREIIRVGEITLMPRAPKFLEGIINLRGRIIPVLDLKKRFEMPLLDRTDETRILVAEIEEQFLGFVVDKVIGVLRVQPSELQLGPGQVLTIGSDFIQALIDLEERRVVLLRLEKLLVLEGVKNLQEMETA